MKHKYFKNRTIQLIAMLISMVVLSTLISLIFSGFRWFSSITDYIHRTEFGFILGFFYGVGNWALAAIISSKFKWHQNLRLYNLLSLMLFLSYGLVISIFIPWYFGAYRMNLDGNNLIAFVSTNGFFGFAIDVTVMIFYHSYYVVYNWNRTINENEKLKRENVEANIRALKSQVNPHFLFNSLNTLTGLVETDTDKSVTYIKKLSQIYRYVLEHKNTELVTLTEELHFTNDYLYLNKIRYGSGIIVNIDIETHKWLIAPISLQLLAENCIKHNSLNENNPVTLNISIDNSYIVAENNIIKKRVIIDKEQQGLNNLVTRYLFLTNRPVIIENNNVTFRVKIPLIMPEQE